MDVKDFFKGKRVLVTGAAGTVGREIARQLSVMETAELRLMDTNESELFFLMQEFADTANCFLGDIRDERRITKLCEGIDIVLHTAAYKHVILSEYNPFDVVQTNIIGIENIIRAAEACGVELVLNTSSDKAVNPTNVMGTSKLMGERLITAANSVKTNADTIFSNTRFGNVLGSRGSVVPIFMRQIKRGGPVTVTDEGMTRFIMTIEESASLVLKSAVLARGGEVFVTKMPVVSIPDMARAMIDVFAPTFGHSPKDIDIKYIGAKPGEKLYEELMSSEEVSRSLELSDMFVITPAFKAIYQDIDYDYPGVLNQSADRPYISVDEPRMTIDELKQYLKDNDIGSSFERDF